VKTRQQLATEYDRLGTMIGAVRSVTRRQLGWAATADLVSDRLRQHLPDPDILKAEQRVGDPLGYACHLLHAEADGSFSVVALVWRPGQATPIHDHVTWCVFGVLQGSEREERYRLGEHGLLEPAGVTTNVAGDVTGLAPPGDIHRVRNAAAQTAISLHIYGTDVRRLGSSVRRTYDTPVPADPPHFGDVSPTNRGKVKPMRWPPASSRGRQSSSAP
jgi:3-mercaptopropionate dioxygenase